MENGNSYPGIRIDKLDSDTVVRFIDQGNDAVVISGTLNMGSHRIVKGADPVDGKDFATKDYVDQISGLVEGSDVDSVNNLTGSLVIAGASGISVSDNDLDTITITGPDLSSFATISTLNSVSGTLQSQIDSQFRGIIHTDFSEQVVLSGSTARTTLFSYTIPANTVTDNRALRITSSYFANQGTGSNPQTVFFHGVLDSSDEIFLKPDVNIGGLSIKVVTTLYPKTNTTQKAISEAVVSAWSEDEITPYSYGSYVIDVRDPTTDMTQDVDFELDGTLSTANAAFYITRNSVIIELL